MCRQEIIFSRQNGRQRQIERDRQLFGIPVGGGPNAEAQAFNNLRDRNLARNNPGILAGFWNTISNWFPRIRFTFRYINNRGAQNPRPLFRAPRNVLPLEQQIERVREVFPQLTNEQIETHLRRADGNVEMAIIHLSMMLQD